jgi:hypothetical protein
MNIKIYWDYRQAKQGRRMREKKEGFSQASDL